MTCAIVILVVDALRSSYVSEDKTPFLAEQASKGLHVKSLIPGHGFCERTEILVGKSMEDSGFFSALKYAPQESPYRAIHPLILKILQVFESFSPRLVRKVLRRIIWEVISRARLGFAPLNVPISELKFFALAEDGAGSLIRHDPDSIYSIARDRGLVVNDAAFTSMNNRLSGGDNERLELALEAVTSASNITLVYLSDCDKYGHKYGPENPLFHTKLREIDNKIRQFVKRVGADCGQIDFVIIGDHGMTEIRDVIDIESVVKGAMSGLSRGKDYISFVDSTVGKVWLHSENARKKATAIIEDCNSLGDAVACRKKEELGGVFARGEYGDILMFASPGVLFSPDSFNSAGENLQGMHGYDPGVCADMHGTLIAWGPSFTSNDVESLSLHAVHGIIKEIMI